VNGSVNINSNLTVLGETTNLYTDVNIRDKVSVINDSQGVAFDLTQKNNTDSILNVSNINDQVFTITKEGNVGIGVTNPVDFKLSIKGNVDIDGEEFKYTISGRDIINDTSNYVLDTSNVISTRITNLVTDNITEELESSNKFIVNHLYNNNLTVNGSVIINSNLTVLGETTYLYTDVNIRDKVSVINDSQGVAFDLTQKNNTESILNVSNINDQVFTITKDGNVGIGVTNPVDFKLSIKGNVDIDGEEFKYTIGGRDIINDTCNYVLDTSNILAKDINFSYNDNSNNIIATSNYLINNIIDTSNLITNDINVKFEATYQTIIDNKFEFSQGMVIQTKHKTYKKMDVKTGNDWEPVNNDIDSGFVISIKPTDITSKILVSLSCHIGAEYSSDSRWWGLKLYRKIGNGDWTEINDANGLKSGYFSSNESGTSCWISHNLGADSSTYSHSIINVSGAYQDEPNTNEIVYYTIYWKNKVGELDNGLLFLNRSEYMYDENYPATSSSWTAIEIWNKGSSYIPPPITNQIQINTEYNNVGIGTSPSTNNDKLIVNGNINIINGSYNINGQDIIQDTCNYIYNTSNILINKINDLLERIILLENS